MWKILKTICDIIVFLMIVSVFGFFIMLNVILYSWWSILTILAYIIAGLVLMIIFVFAVSYLNYVWKNKKFTGYFSYIKSLNQ
jgi:hypothetical protein